MNDWEMIPIYMMYVVLFVITPMYILFVVWSWMCDLREREQKRHKEWLTRTEHEQLNVKKTRYMQIAENGGRHTRNEWETLCRRFGYKCVRCGERKELTKDHIVPISQGGNNTIENIQPLCRECNSSKGTKTIRYIKGVT